jgi:periplasmic divalent cation tolerance protein
MPEHIQVLTTVSSREEAERISRVLVEEHLAACVQVLGPITSTYRWQGAIETSQEWLCVAKSRRELYDAIEKAIRGVHSYQVPEILAVPIIAGSADYLAWVDQEIERPASRGE